MTYAEILAAVTALTNREDMAAEKETMIQAATLRMHHSDFYARDLSEATINTGSLSYAFSFDAPTTCARFRAMHYLRKYDNVAAVAGDVLEHIDPTHLFDEYKVERNDVWYAAGNNIVIRSSTPLQYMRAGWYQNPIVSPVANYASWVADLVPHAIIFDACSLIFQMLAQQEQSRKFDALVLEQVGILKMHGFDAHGY